MKLNIIRRKHRSGFTLVELMVVIAIIVTLAGVAYPIVLNQRNSGDRSAAAANLGNLHKTLQMFQNDHGAYPCDATADRFLEDERYITASYGTLTGNTSNCYFRQLFYLPGVESEENFFAKINDGNRITKEPDNKIANGRALERGECGFGYVMKKGSDEEGDANVKGAVSKTSAPLILTSILGRQPVSGDNLTMDAVSFNERAIVLFNSGAVKQINLNVNPEDDTQGSLKNIFPENKRTGRDQSDQYIVLPPDL